jgi:hypothetical protein
VTSTTFDSGPAEVDPDQPGYEFKDGEREFNSSDKSDTGIYDGT